MWHIYCFILWHDSKACLIVAIITISRVQKAELMSPPPWEGQIYISVSILGDITDTMEGDVNGLQFQYEIHIDTIIQALQSGYSMHEIKKEFINQLEKEIIKQVMILTKGNKSKSSRLLNIDYKTLYRKLKIYSI